MGRKSKLTDKQWNDIGKRLLNGERVRALALEYKVAASTISDRFSEQNNHIKTLANSIISTELQVKQLPISEQIAVHGLADRLRSISMGLTDAAMNGAAVASKLSGIASVRASKLNPDDPIDEEEVKQIAGLMRVANIGAEIPLNLLRANKELNDAASGDKEVDQPISKIIYEVVHARA